MSGNFVKHMKSNRGKVSLSAVLIVSILSLTGVFVFARNNGVNAAAITSASDLMDISAPNATSNHTIQFTLGETLDAGETITVTFPSGFSTTSGLTFEDMDLATGTITGDEVLANTASASTWGATTSGDVVVTFTSGTDTIVTSTVVYIQIGSNATAGATGDAWLQNPTKSAAAGVADVYTVSIGGTNPNSGDVLVAVVEGVAVSVTIDESLSFSVTSTTNADCDTKFATHAGPDSTASTVPFGSQSSANTFVHACQDLSVSTNASSGFTVYASENRALKSGSNLISNGVCDTACTETATDTWGTATNNGFAYSSTGTNSVITATTHYKTFACTGATTTDCLPGGGETQQGIMTKASPANNSTMTVEYKLSFSGTQQAGTYSNTVTYVATPTF